MDKKLIVVGVGMAAEAFGTMRHFKGSPYNHKDFHFLIQSAHSASQYQIYRDTKRHFYYTQQQHLEPKWSVLPHIAEKGFDKVALISQDNYVYWPDVLFWVMNQLREEQRKPSTIVIKPYYQHVKNVMELRSKLLKTFPPFIELARTKGTDLYADLPVADSRDFSSASPFHSLPHTYVRIQDHDPQHKLPIKVKIHVEQEGESFIHMLYEAHKEKAMPVQRYASVSI